MTFIRKSPAVISIWVVVPFLSLHQQRWVNHFLSENPYYGNYLLACLSSEILLRFWTLIPNYYKVSLGLLLAPWKFTTVRHPKLALKLLWRADSIVFAVKNLIDNVVKEELYAQKYLNHLNNLNNDEISDNLLDQ